MADEKPDDKGKAEETHDAALEKLSEKLAKAAGSSDVGPLKEIVQQFYHDAVDLRTKNRELTRELAAAKGKIKDGDVVLTGDDAKAWQAIQKLNIPAGEISKKLTEGVEAQQKLGVYERDRVADAIAELTGQNAKALRGIVKLHNLNVQIQEVPDPSGARDAEGKAKKVKRAVVIPVGDKAEPIEWDEYVEQNLGDFREVLAGSESERNGNREPPAPRITRQRSGDGGGARGVTTEQLEREIAQQHGGPLRV